jgi:glycerol-3-phosphate acyltransferase PlsY
MIWALTIGFLLGSIPSADLVGRVVGIDLRGEGSGNPGAANALRLGGRGPAAAVLALDLVKGIGATLVGAAIDGDGTAIAAGVAAVAGQIHNPWFGFEGGKGLGVAGGTAFLSFPAGLLATAALMGVAARRFGTGVGGTVGLTAFLASAITWAALDLPMGWGVATDDRLVWYAIGITVLAMPKFLAGVKARARA